MSNRLVMCALKKYDGIFYHHYTVNTTSVYINNGHSFCLFACLLACLLYYFLSAALLQKCVVAGAKVLLTYRQK